MSTSALPLDLTPASIEKLSRQLPAQTRATLSWFPNEFRTILIEPLRAASVNDWLRVFKRASVEAARLFLRLSSSLAPLLKDPNVAAFLHDANTEARRQQIAARLERLDQTATDEMLEAVEWMRVILVAILEVASVDNIGTVPELDDKQLRDELRGRRGSLLRGEILTLAVLEVVSDECPLPESIVEWCEVACQEMNTAANYLRAYGLPVPTKISIPGFTPRQWRARAHSVVLDAFTPKNGLPPNTIERIVEVLAPEEIWLFGSRARGTHGPNSDWDILAVLPDNASDDKLDIGIVWNKLYDLLRWRVEVIPMRRSDFEEERRSPGSLASNVVREGYAIYEK